jgi:hypothetical protein
MVRGRVMFPEVVGKVGGTRLPVDLELFSADLVLHPV